MELDEKVESMRGGLPMTEDAVEAAVGDVIEIVGHRVGEGRRLGEIVEILGAPEHVHYRVRWEDGRETVFYPSSDAVVRRGPSRRQPLTSAPA
jgi:hypothetical protein